MKLRNIFLITIIMTLSTGLCTAQDDVAARLTEEAINARIAQNRMGEIIVKTAPGANVEVRQTRHEFLFGTAIPNQLAENSRGAMSDDDRKQFIKILTENFNYAVHENALKWYDCERREGVVDYSVADRIWEICNENNISMRGHCIFWAKDKYIMPWLGRLNNDQLRAAVHRRALDVTQHFKGRINEFDLNNEMVHGDFFRRRLGYGIVNEMAFMAKMGNPDAKLYLNDYGILVQGYNADTFIWQVRNLLANGVPLDGIGCQGHLAHYTIATTTPAEHVQRTLDTLTEFGLPIKITECLFIYDDEQRKVDEFHKVFPIYFAHPNIEAIVMWGFWEPVLWKPEAAMWKKDWTPTPLALAYRDLVYNKWWTDTSGKADSEGTFKTAAFYGDYEITSNGKTQKVSLKKSEKSKEVTFN